MRTLLPRAEPVFCAACAKASGGNPYLLREFVMTLRDAGLIGRASEALDIDHVVPRSVASAALVRIARLGDHALALAQAVAVLGDGTSLELAAKLASRGPGEGILGQTADALAAVGVLAPGLPLQFAHPLLAAAVHADMPPVSRQLAHASAATALAETGAPAAAVAAHLLLGPRPFDAAAVAALLATAQEALARDNVLAAERVLTALLEQPLPNDVRRQAETGLALAEAAAGRQTALARLQQALLDEREPAARAESLRVLWQLHFARGEFIAAGASAREAHEAVGPEHPMAATFIAMRLACATFGPPDAVEPEVAAVRRCLVQDAVAGHMPEDPALLVQLAALAAVYGLPAQQVAAMSDAAFPPAVRDAAEWEGWTLAFLAAAGVYTEDVPRAERAIAEYDRFAIARGSAQAWSTARRLRAELRFRQGRIDEAIADAEEALAIPTADRAFSMPRAAALVVRGQIARGDLAAARAAQDLADTADQHSLFAAHVQAARGELLLAQGDLAAALAALEGAGRRLAERGFSNAGVLPWRPQAVVAAMALEYHDRAAELAAEELDEARRIGLQVRIGAALRAQALATRDVEQRTSLLERAVAALEPAIDRLELANALADLGALNARRGRIADAREPLARAAELAVLCGAAPLAARAEAALASIGARARRGADRDRLTATERQIVEFAAEGMTNREIAGRLVITPKTVEWHLTHAYAKLGVNSRRELADALGTAIV